VVATLGTALTPEHAKLIHRYTKNVVVMFDGDDAGQAAAERSAPILLQQGLYPRGLVLPSGCDPDDFVTKYGADHLQELLQTAPELFSILMQREMKGFTGTQAERVAILDRLAPVVHATSDQRLKDLYVSEMASWLNVDKKWAFNAIKKSGLENANPRKLDPPVNVPPALGVEALSDAGIETESIIILEDAPRAEIELLNLALLKHEYLDEILETNIVSFFGHAGTKQVFSKIEQCYRQMPSEFDTLLRNLINQVNPPSALSLHLEKPFAEISKEGAKKLISDCARRIRETYLRARHKEIASHLRGLRSSDQLDQLEQIMNLQKDRLALKNEPEPH
jgi:DNA primase